jgi:hypothetical protein
MEKQAFRACSVGLEAFVNWAGLQKMTLVAYTGAITATQLYIGAVVYDKIEHI